MKLLCRECEHLDEPKEVGGGLQCKNCHYPFSYFDVSAFNNEKKKRRLEEERSASNKRVTKTYGLKGK